MLLAITIVLYVVCCCLTCAIGLHLGYNAGFRDGIVATRQFARMLKKVAPRLPDLDPHNPYNPDL